MVKLYAVLAEVAELGWSYRWAEAAESFFQATTTENRQQQTRNKF